MAGIKLLSVDWSVRAGRASARRGTAMPAGLPAEFLTDESVVAEEFVAQPKLSARREASEPGPLDFSYQLGSGESAILAIRHPSGALTFHLPVAATRRSGKRSGEVRFTVPLRSLDTETGRRSLVGKVLKAVIVKVAKGTADKLVTLLLPKLAAAFERTSWKKRRIEEGWLRVTRSSLAAGQLVPGKPSSAERSLLLIHGTFSDAVGAYRALATSTFFDRVAQAYGDRVFAFNHFTISRSPEENARMLLESLPNDQFTFDVITHSRGGLVLRNLVERAAVYGRLASRFRLGRAVLVASPNEGTPLATPTRWQETVGWLANLLELFPENPFTTGTEFVANGLVWLARHASGDLPGLHSMDGAGDAIGLLQSPPGPPPDAYSALVANYNPTGDVLQRLLDTGVDQFFSSANDLVVPSEGGWRVDHAAAPYIPGERIGCYGPGGNIPVDSVTHVSFFSRRETVDFLVPALLGQPSGLPPIDPAKSLPNRRVFRSANSGGATPQTEGLAASPLLTQLVPEIPRSAGAPIWAAPSAVVASDTFHLVILPRSESQARHSQILAHYGSARVLEDFYLGGADANAGSRWHTIIARHESIKNYVNGTRGQMPTDAELQEFGEVLFETLFPGAVRRLYDTARSLQRSERLNVVLTSTIPWVAEKPWEFAYDPVRQTSLATEELHFIRNVMTAVPAEIIDDQKRLRILVASSQPINFGRLSIAEEEAVIRRGFQPLIDAGRADVDVLARATPASLHSYVATGKYAVVHFIGHGAYDADADRGYLVFQDDHGNPYNLDDRSIREIMCGRGIRLVFLNACESGQGGHADFNSGVAPALVAGGVPIVVANQYKVLDTSATLFAQHFYWSLTQGMTLGAAAREARVAVNYSLSGESIDWAVPVVYARDPNSRLCPAIEQGQAVILDSPVRGSSRRRAAMSAVRIAVWDTHSQFPGLSVALERINASQLFYDVDLVDLSVPMDAWHFDDDTRYLDADRFAERLSPQISQLGVDYVAAIVDEWMVCDLGSEEAMYNIYGWWPTHDQPPVLVFSTKGLGMAPSGPATERAIANLLVAGIAGYLMDGDSHEKGARDCPNYFDANRELKLLTAPQEFCKPCSQLIRKRYPAEFKAMNQILRAFDE